MSLSTDLATKSVEAAVASIDVYNKPTSYREEGFALLMSNAWELLLKAKRFFDHDEALDSLYELIDLISPVLKGPRPISIEL